MGFVWHCTPRTLSCLSWLLERGPCPCDSVVMVPFREFGVAVILFTAASNVGHAFVVFPKKVGLVPTFFVDCELMSQRGLALGCF